MYVKYANTINPLAMLSFQVRLGFLSTLSYHYLYLIGYILTMTENNVITNLTNTILGSLILVTPKG